MSNTSVDCPDCDTEMVLVDIDCYKCPKCSSVLKIVDMYEDEEL